MNVCCQDFLNMSVETTLGKAKGMSRMDTFTYKILGERRKRFVARMGHTKLHVHAAYEDIIKCQSRISANHERVLVLTEWI